MPDLYALDTNVYTRAQRDQDAAAWLQRFAARFARRTRLASLVVMELRAGATSPRARLEVNNLVAPYRRYGWVLHPSLDAVLESGRVLGALPTNSRAEAPARVVDAMIAAGCREAGVVLVTHNARDFAAIQRQLRGFRFVAP